MGTESERRFSDKETGEILRRAAEIQSGKDSSDSPDGLTLEEIRRVAGEVGIRPEAIEVAANEIQRPVPEVGKARSGVHSEQMVPGVLSDQAWEDMVNELRIRFGIPGEMSETGSVREWKGKSDMLNVTFTVSPRGGSTQIRMMSDRSGAAAFTWVFALVSSLFSTIFTTVVLAKNGVGFGVGVFAALAVIGSIVYMANRYVEKQLRKHDREMQALVKDLRRFVSQPAAAQSQTQVEAEPLRDQLEQGQS